MKLTHSPPFKTWQSKNLPLTQYETRLITAPVAFITRAVIRDLISAFFIITILSKRFLVIMCLKKHELLHHRCVFGILHILFGLL